MNARELHADGTYELPDRRGRQAVNSQLELYRLAREAVARRGTEAAEAGSPYEG